MVFLILGLGQWSVQFQRSIPFSRGVALSTFHVIFVPGRDALSTTPSGWCVQSRVQLAVLVQRDISRWDR